MEKIFEVNILFLNSRKSSFAILHAIELTYIGRQT